MKKYFLAATAVALALLIQTANAGPLPGLTGSESLPPPATGDFSYNGFAPSLFAGASFTDPVFGTTVRRLTTDHTPDDTYARNMWWNASGTLFLHRAADGTPWPDFYDIIDAATGQVLYSGIPNGSLAADGGFDPVDPNVLYYLSGGSIHKVILESNGKWSDSIYFTAPNKATLKSLGGTINWLDAGGKHMVVRFGAEPSVHLYDTQNLSAGPYSNPIDGSNSIDTGSYLGLTPDGQYIVGYQDSGTRGISFKIDHSNKSVASAPATFWSLCGDHGSFLSASDGRDYMITYNCNNHSELWRVDVSNNAAGLSENEQKVLPNNKLLLSFSTWNDGGHISTAAKGELKDWAFFSTEDGADTFDSSVSSWHPYRQEIDAVNVMSGEIKRLAHHRSRSVYSNYSFQPRLSVSWAGEYVAFPSNFDSGQVDIYAIPLIPSSAQKIINPRALSVPPELAMPAPPPLPSGSATNIPTSAINSVAIKNITARSATIVWRTNLPATSQIKFGRNVSYKYATKFYSKLVAKHQLQLTGLSKRATYHFQILSKDISGNVLTSADYLFTTKKK